MSRVQGKVPIHAHHGLHSLRATVATKLLSADVSPDIIFHFLAIRTENLWDITSVWILKTCVNAPCRLRMVISYEQNLQYRSGLASQISAFIAEKRACGCKYEKEAKTFQTLDRFLVEQGINTPVLPELVVEKWIEKRPNEKRKNQKWRLNFTKRFAKYLQLNGYAAYYPELTISSRDDADFSPCIFTSDELARIMKYFETMVPSRQCPTAHLVFPLLFKTLICCGLRAGEATRLRVKM